MSQFHMGEQAPYLPGSYDSVPYGQFPDAGTGACTGEPEPEGTSYAELSTTTSAKGKGKSGRSRRTRSDDENTAVPFSRDTLEEYHNTIGDGGTFDEDAGTFLEDAANGQPAPACSESPEWDAFKEYENCVTEHPVLGEYDAENLSESGGGEVARPDERPLTRWDILLRLLTRRQKWKEAEGFLDSGNGVGPPILRKTVFDLGFKNQDINFRRMVEFDTFGGLVRTLGVVTLDYQIVKTGGVDTHDPPRQTDFHILERPLGKYEVWLQPDHDISSQANTSMTVAATLQSKRELTDEERKQQKESYLRAEKEAERQKQKKKEREEKAERDRDRDKDKEARPND